MFSTTEVFSSVKYYKVHIPLSGSTVLLLINVSELLDLPDPEELF
jgi:hypothetical protein